MGPDPPRGKDQLLGSIAADQAWQVLRAASARDDPQTHLGEPEHSVLRRHDEVREHR